MNDELPPLPKPTYYFGHSTRHPMYAPEEMRSYATSAISALKEENERLRKALSALVQCNEEWNASVEKIVGRPPNWTDGYLDKARAALKAKS